MSDCTHRFQIAPANGPISMGRCKWCKEEREFKNSAAKPLSYVEIRQMLTIIHSAKIAAPGGVYPRETDLVA